MKTKNSPITDSGFTLIEVLITSSILVVLGGLVLTLIYITTRTRLSTFKILTEDVRNGIDPIFYYYNGDWPADTLNNPLAQPVRLSDTKLMKVYLKLNTEDDPSSDFILESYTQLRILKE